MTDSLTQVIKNSDGSHLGAWGPFQLRSAYQPIYRFHETGSQLYAFEALVRPFRGDEPVPPDYFFSLVPEEEVVDVEAVIQGLHIRNAAHRLARDEYLFLNFDPILLRGKLVAQRWMERLQAELQSNGLRVGQVVIEITEHKIADEAAARAYADLFRQFGFRLAVDDFGADNSDIMRVDVLQPEIIKFDAKWVNALIDTMPGVELLRAMVQKFYSRGILTLMEGLENIHHVALAKSINVDMVQGYALARPKVIPFDFNEFRKGNEFMLPKVKTGSAAQDEQDIALDTVDEDEKTACAKEMEPEVATTPVRQPQGRTFGRRRSNA